MAEPVIRAAQPADAGAIAHLWTELVAWHHALDPALPGPTPQSDEYYAGRVVQSLGLTNTCVLVADQAGELVGYVLASHAGESFSLPADIRRGLIADLFVCPEYRRRGIGRRLVTSATAWFAERGLGSFEWQMAANNPEAAAFWQHFGGQPLLIHMWATTPEGEL